MELQFPLPQKTHADFVVKSRTYSPKEDFLIWLLKQAQSKGLVLNSTAETEAFLGGYISYKKLLLSSKACLKVDLLAAYGFFGDFYINKEASENYATDLAVPHHKATLTFEVWCDGEDPAGRGWGADPKDPTNLEMHQLWLLEQMVPMTDFIYEQM